MVQSGATWCKVVQDGARWCKMVHDGARWCKMVQDGARLCKMVQDSAIPCNTMQYHAIPCNTMQFHISFITADGAYHCPVGSIMAIFSSVRSSYSHPDLLLIHHPLFQITPVLNTGLSLSEPLQLQGGFFDCSALKMTKCQPLKEISELFLRKSQNCSSRKTTKKRKKSKYPNCSYPIVGTVQILKLF